MIEKGEEWVHTHEANAKTLWEEMLKGIQEANPGFDFGNPDPGYNCKVRKMFFPVTYIYNKSMVNFPQNEYYYKMWHHIERHVWPKNYFWSKDFDAKWAYESLVKYMKEHEDELHDPDTPFIG